MTTKYFLIEFNDLSFEKQQEMIGEVRDALIETYKDETENGRYGVNFGREEYKDMSWEEAFVREYSIDWRLWETKEEADKFNWDFAIEQYAESEAEKECSSSLIENKVEVEI